MIKEHLKRIYYENDDIYRTFHIIGLYNSVEDFILFNLKRFNILKEYEYVQEIKTIILKNNNIKEIQDDLLKWLSRFKLKETTINEIVHLFLSIKRLLKDYKLNEQDVFVYDYEFNHLFDLKLPLTIDNAKQIILFNLSQLNHLNQNQKTNIIQVINEMFSL